MRNKDQKGFTLIELLVVIAIIGLLSTLAVVALNSARQKSRDTKRVADVKQIQTALELYYADNNGYPVAATPLVLGTGNNVALCGTAAGWTAEGGCGAATTYMGLVPKAPTPADNASGITECTDTAGSATNVYSYSAATSTTYTISFCLGGGVGDLKAGKRSATPNGIQ